MNIIPLSKIWIWTQTYNRWQLFDSTSAELFINKLQVQPEHYSISIYGQDYVTVITASLI